MSSNKKLLVGVAVPIGHRAQLATAWSNLEGRITLVRVLFVATPTSTISVSYFSMCPSMTSTISVYYFSVCTVCGHYHTNFSICTVCGHSLVCTTLVYVHYFSICTVCGHSHTNFSVCTVCGHYHIYY